MSANDFHAHCPQNLTEARFRYHHERFQQLNNLLVGHSSQVWEFLKAVNGGGAVAILAYVAAVGSAKATALTWISLVAFSLGLALVGFALALLVHKADELTGAWVRNFEHYLAGEISWPDLIRNDKELVENLKAAPWILGWGSFALFFIGLACAAKYFFAQ